MSGSTGIDNLTAALLSQAASFPVHAPPAGWTALPEYSYSPVPSLSIGINSFTTFVNTGTKQIVIAFQGTDFGNYVFGPPQLLSDLADEGYAAWESLAPTFLSYLSQIQINTDYAGYQVMTDGHSLGGGLAQTAALEFGLSGYGQNSLPVSKLAIQNDTQITQQGGFQNALAAWQAAGNTFSEVNTAGDPATNLFAGQAYISTSTTTLANPYASIEAYGAAVAGISGSGNNAYVPPLLVEVGEGIAAYGELKAHAIATVITALQNNASSTEAQSLNSTAAQRVSLNATPLLNSQPTLTAADTSFALTAFTSSTSTLNSDGSVEITESDGLDITLSNTGSIVPSTLQSGQDFIYSPGSSYNFLMAGSDLSQYLGSGEALFAVDPATENLLAFEQSTSLNSGIIQISTQSGGGLAIDGSANADLNIMAGVAGSTTMQSVFDFSEGGQDGETVYLSYTSDGNADLTLDLGSGDTTDISVDDSLVSVVQDFSFGGAGGDLELNGADSFAGAISGFDAGDTIDLLGILATGGSLGTSNVLTVQQSGGSNIALQLSPTDNFSGTSFIYSSDGNGGTEITESTWNVAPADPIVNEDAGQEVFTIARAGDISQAATVYVSTTDGSNFAGEDVNNGQFDAFSNQAVIFAAGQPTATVPVMVNDTGNTTGSELNFGLQVTDSPSASANTIASDPFSILEDDVGSNETYSSITYNYTGNSFTTGTNGQPNSTQTFTFVPSSVDASFTIDNVPFDYTGYIGDQISSWQMSAYGITINSSMPATYPMDDVLSTYDISLSSGVVTSWEFIMQWIYNVNLPKDLIIFLSSSLGSFSIPCTDYANNEIVTSEVGWEDITQENNGYTAIPGTWTVGSSTLATNITLSPGAGQVQSLNDVLGALNQNNQAAHNLIISGAGSVALAGTIANIPTVDVEGTLSLQNGTLETDPITVDADGVIFGYGTISGSQTVDGTVTAIGGILDIAGNVSGSGTLFIAANAALLLDDTVAATQVLDFSGTAATLIVGSSSEIAGTISNFSADDIIALQGQQIIGFTDDTSKSQIVLTTSSDTDVTLNLSGLQSNDLSLLDGEVIDYALCFLEGTHIRTPGGETPIEQLKIGDLVVTGAGEAKPIKWIGRRAYDGRFIAGNHLALPVCIKQNAIAGRVPARDLDVSPGHGIFIDGVLVPAWRLVNGVSITQAESAQSVHYINVELESHEIILANNCPAETFLNIGNFRDQFQNADEFKKLYADDDGQQTASIPRLEEGFKLHAIQSYLAGRAGIVMPAEGQGDMVHGFVDEVGPQRVRGWVQCVHKPDTPVSVDIWVGGSLVARSLANGYRADLSKAGLGSGCHGFDIPVPTGLSGRVRVRRTIDQAELVLGGAAELRVA